jgi:hypothetical protein
MASTVEALSGGHELGGGQEPGPAIRPTRADDFDRPSASAPIWEMLPAAERGFMQATSLVRLTAAARWLGVRPASLRRHVHEGQCSGRKFDGEWFVGRGTVERWRVRHAADTTER